MDTPGATSQPDSRRTWPAGWHVEVVDETGSTNTDLLAAAAAGAPDRTVLVARHQTAGRGRLDRRWDAPPGANLLASVLIRDVPVHLHEVTQRVALAAQRACRTVAGVEATLKWPNDLLIDDRKLAGVLAQAGGAAGGGGVQYVVVGIGLNVGWAPEWASRLGDGIDPLDVLDALLRAYDALPVEIHAEYRAGLGTLGRAVRVEVARAGGDIEGRAIDVEPDGRLVVLDGCGITHRIDTGDVVHLR
jgi:BirA family biotin operon repressor/biotin-[acetyl-CoA-carboxylase] ligase